MLKYRAGIDILHVPYRGSADALNDLLPNTVQMMNEINVIPHVKAGKLHAAQHQSQRASPGFPDVPTLTEARLPELRRADLVLDLGTGGHARRTSSTKLNAKMRRDRQDRRHEGAHARHQRHRAVQTPAEMAAFQAEDSKGNAEVIKAGNIKLE